MITKIDAILALNKNTRVTQVGSSLHWGDETPISDKIITAKIAELEAVEPLRVLREQRNQIILATDWQASSDLTMTAEQTAYRKALRDLPSTATPSLDSDGQLTGVTWPTKPE
jgi:hypothetical protein